MGAPVENIMFGSWIQPKIKTKKHGPNRKILTLPENAPRAPLVRRAPGRAGPPLSQARPPGSGPKIQKSKIPKKHQNVDFEMDPARSNGFYGSDFSPLLSFSNLAGPAP